MAKDRVMIWGGGGREHTLLWKLAQSPEIDELYYTKENAGMAEVRTATGKLAQLVEVKSIDEAIGFAKGRSISLTVFGPEAPLVDGAVDKFKSARLRAFGPSAEAANLEGSKVWTKRFLDIYEIPTAGFRVFDSPELALAYVKKEDRPLVIKADELAAGKGALVCRNPAEQPDAIRRLMIDHEFGANVGNRIVIEDFMEGEEASILAFVDGENILPLVATQDHKPAYDNDQGPNTGGMGAYGPAPVVSDEVLERIINDILHPTVEGMRKIKMPFKGCLYAGLMIDKQGNPRLVEYNIRFGDPEAQSTLVLTESDIYPVMHACVDGTLDEEVIKTIPGAACCVVLASPGYPGAYEKGKVITGLEDAQMGDVTIFHAGTKKVGNDIVTAGGRVLGVTAFGINHEIAVKRAYNAAEKIRFDGKPPMYRKDIGHKALNR